MQKILSLLLFCFLGMPTVQIATIRFGSQRSAITLLNNTTLDVTRSFTTRGSIRQRGNADIRGNTIYFDLGKYEKNLSPSVITGDLYPDSSTTETIKLYGTSTHPNILRADPGARISFLEIEGTHNRIEGFPLFDRPVRLVDGNSTATFAMQAALNQNIEFNDGSTIVLDNALSLADGVSLTGRGTIKLNNRRIEFGSEDLNITSSLYWVGAADVYLSGQIDLSGSWTFEGDCYFNGDSTVMTLTNGGNITIRKNSTLTIRELKIAGLGNEPDKGKIYFEDDDNPSTSMLRIRRGALELTTTYTVYSGHTYVEIGSGLFITRDNTIYFEPPPLGSGKLTVDGVNLLYKTRTFTDNKNVQPRPYDGDPIELINQGDILHYRTLTSGQGESSTAIQGSLNDNIYLGGEDFYFGVPPAPDGHLLLDSTYPTLNGFGWYIHFGARGFRHLHVAAGVDGKLTNIVLKDFRKTQVQLFPDAELIFAGDVTIELPDIVSLGDSINSLYGFSPKATWTFEGSNNIINGQGNPLIFGNGQILLQGPQADLTFQNVRIRDLREDSIVIENDDSTVTFKDCHILLSEDFEFIKGSFEIEGMVKVASMQKDGSEVRFAYNTSKTSTVRKSSCLHFDRNVMFSYAPPTPNNNLLEFIDETSILSFNGGTLAASSTGLLLTKGSMLIDHHSFVESGATNNYEAIILGDGADAANDFSVNVMPEGSLDILSGILLHNNVNG